MLREREFRANQSKYFGAVSKGEDVVIKSRSVNSHLVPIKDGDKIVSRNDPLTVTSSVTRGIYHVSLAKVGGNIYTLSGQRVSRERMQKDFISSIKEDSN